MNTPHYKSQSRHCMAAKRIKARRLFVNQLYNQKEVAEMCNVTQKTMGSWVNKFGWKDLQAKAVEKATKVLLEEPVSNEAVLIDLMDFIKGTAPDIADKCNSIIQKYLDQFSVSKTH